MPDPTQTNNFDSTIELLQQDLESVDPAIAILIIERWEEQLQGTDIFEDLSALKLAIFNSNTPLIKKLLSKLGQEISAMAVSLRAESTQVAAKVDQIGMLLSQAEKH